jgi:hypothetical protein
MRYLKIVLMSSSLVLSVALHAGDSAPAFGSQKDKAVPGMQETKTQVPAEMKQRCRMMMQTAINPFDPTAILGLKDDLKLSTEQAQKLQAIVDKARQEAKGVLNEQQAKTLGAIPAKPETSMAMHEHMMEMMQQKHGKQAGGNKMDCPMMSMIAPTTQPAQAEPATNGHEAHHH